MMTKEADEKEKLMVQPDGVSSRQEFRCLLATNDAKNGIAKRFTTSIKSAEKTHLAVKVAVSPGFMI